MVNIRLRSGLCLRSRGVVPVLLTAFGALNLVGLPSIALASESALQPEPSGEKTAVDSAKVLHATPKIFKETTVAEPGKTFWIAVHFTIEPEWHIYWNGLNDSGLAPAFKVSLPDGWTMGKVRWPVPVRHVAEGDILDYIYEKEATLLLPVEVPANVAVGEVASVKLAASWLVCSNVCLPEKTDLTVNIRVGTPGAAKPVESSVEIFRKARAALPLTLPPSSGSAENGQTEQAKPPFEAKIEGTSLVIQAPDATKVTFMPSAESVALSNAVAEGQVTGSVLRAELADSTDEQHSVSGIVQVWSGTKFKAFWIDLPMVAAGAEKSK